MKDPQRPSRTPLRALASLRPGVETHPLPAPRIPRDLRGLSLWRLCVALLLWPSLLLAPPLPPAWWAGRGATNATPADDFAAANVGQLKHFATKAVAELEGWLPGGAGATLTGMVANWTALSQQQTPPGPAPGDYSAVNLGQLKHVARPFYDRLMAVGYATGYPWTPAITDDVDSAMANLGQLKRVFAFGPTVDADGDGIPDWWEAAYPHDSFNQARTIADAGIVRGINLYATKEDGEPDHAGNTGGASLWFRWQPSVSDSVVFDTLGSNFDTTLAVYTGADFSSLSFVVSDDDGGPRRTSRVEFQAQAGVTYWIAMDGFSGASGAFTLRWAAANSDTDGDGILGWYEMANGLNLLLNDAALDNDTDGLTNLQEFNLGTAANNFDSDGDLLADGWEVQVGIDPLSDTGVNGADGDIDGDGLTNLTEYLNSDTDGDGMPTGYETANGLNPVQNDAALDKDSDGLTNLLEFNLGTAANNFDSDGDLLADGWEVQWSLNPSSSAGVNGKDGDFDGDGLTNFQEQIHGTNPRVADTDMDGVNDAAEIDQGGDPNSGSDSGQPPPADTVVEVPFTVGDDSGSNSERWMMQIKGTDPQKDGRQFDFQSEDFGTVGTKSFKLRRGASYEITLKHLGTDPGWVPPADYPGTADYDWDATVGGLPTTPVKEPGAMGSLFVVGGAWLVDNRQGLLGLNDGGDLEPANQAQNRKALLIPMEFQTIDITKGFDFPLHDDPPDAYTVGMTPPIVKDQDNPEWWTSVARTDASGRGLNVNHHVKLVFGSVAAANLCEIRSSDTSLLYVDGDGVGGTGNLTKAETLLTLTGRNTGTPGIQTVEVQVRTKNSSHQVLLTLKVLVMPERKVRLRVHFVEDHTLNVGTPDFPMYLSEVPAAYKDVTGIVNKLNEVYRQNCLIFIADNPGSGTLDVRGWDFTPDGILDCENTPRTGPVILPSELSRVEPNITLQSGALHILVFRKISVDGGVAGFWMPGFMNNCVFIGAENFQNAVDTPAYHKARFMHGCAHEVGHTLGLSVRRRIHPTTNSVDPHDGGTFPTRYNFMRTLMYPDDDWLTTDNWLRHEEWQPAWLNARFYVLP